MQVSRQSLAESRTSVKTRWHVKASGALTPCVRSLIREVAAAAAATTTTRVQVARLLAGSRTTGWQPDYWLAPELFVSKVHACPHDMPTIKSACNTRVSCKFDASSLQVRCKSDASLILHQTCIRLASYLHQTCIRLASDLHQTCIRLASDLHQTCIKLAS